MFLGCNNCLFRSRSQICLKKFNLPSQLFSSKILLKSKSRNRYQFNGIYQLVFYKYIKITSMYFVPFVVHWIVFRLKHWRYLTSNGPAKFVARTPLTNFVPIRSSASRDTDSPNVAEPYCPAIVSSSRSVSGVKQFFYRHRQQQQKQHYMTIIVFSARVRFYSALSNNKNTLWWNMFKTFLMEYVWIVFFFFFFDSF